MRAAKFFSDWSQPTTWGACTDLGGRFSATVFSIINTAGTLGGVAMPIVFGTTVLDRFTDTSTGDIVTGLDVATTDWNPLFVLAGGHVSRERRLLASCRLHAYARVEDDT